MKSIELSDNKVPFLIPPQLIQPFQVGSKSLFFVKNKHRYLSLVN